VNSKNKNILLKIFLGMNLSPFLNQWNPFSFFLPSVIQSSDPARKSSVSTAEGLPFSPKTAPGAEPLSF
jgi:hypothetical protein